jgi:hypothetical protein
MTTKEAVEYLIREFVTPFGCNAESLAKSEKTHEVLRVLDRDFGLGLSRCPGEMCGKSLESR